jgi:hypothetical protein
MDGNPELLAPTVGRTPFPNKTRRSRTEGERQVQNVSDCLSCAVGIEPAMRKQAAVQIDFSHPLA